MSPEPKIQLPSDNPLADMSVDIGGAAYRVWPGDLPLIRYPMGVAVMICQDVAHLKQDLVEKILASALHGRAVDPPPHKGAGGQKVRNLPGFESPFFDLINKRAQALFMLTTESKTAVVDDCWANVFRDRKYAMPHCHKRAEASAVFSLKTTPESVTEQDHMDGVLYFADPRFPGCAPARKGYVSESWMPLSHHECGLVVFPAFMTHGVTAHRGDEPRISIAWNMNRTKLKGEVRHDGKMV